MCNWMNAQLNELRHKTNAAITLHKLYLRDSPSFVIDQLQVFKLQTIHFPNRKDSQLINTQ